MRNKTKALFFLVIVSLIFGGCEARQISGREGGALAGGALGTGIGAIIGHATHHLGGGMAIGGAAGAIAGGLIGNQSDNANDKITEGNQKLDEQDREIEGNRRLLEELRSKGLDARSTDRGVVVNLPNVLFDFGSDRLTSAADSTTRKIANALKSSHRHAIVEGHTDSVGTAEYNLGLSRRRAQSVARALEDNGIPQNRISTKGLGKSDPIASNDTESGRERNRRVEVILQR